MLNIWLRNMNFVWPAVKIFWLIYKFLQNISFVWLWDIYCSLWKVCHIMTCRVDAWRGFLGNSQARRDHFQVPRSILISEQNCGQWSHSHTVHWEQILGKTQPGSNQRKNICLIKWSISFYQSQASLQPISVNNCCWPKVCYRHRVTVVSQ